MSKEGLRMRCDKIRGDASEAVQRVKEGDYKDSTVAVAQTRLLKCLVEAVVALTETELLFNCGRPRC